MVPGARLAISRSAAKLLSTYCTLAGLKLEENKKPPAGGRGLPGSGMDSVLCYGAGYERQIDYPADDLHLWCLILHTHLQVASTPSIIAHHPQR